MQTPLRQVLVHYRNEPIVMMPVDEVHEFVNHDIFEALHRLLGEFEIQPDATSFDATGAPLGFHLLDAPVSDLRSLPLCQFAGPSNKQSDLGIGIDSVLSTGEHMI
jgi:hypothetical protein